MGTSLVIWTNRDWGIHDAFEDVILLCSVYFLTYETDVKIFVFVHPMLP